jgi:hypothetical protein
MLALGSTALTAGTAEGFIQIGTVRKELHFAKAAHVKDRFDPTRQVLHVVLSDTPIPSKALFDGGRLFALTSRTDIQVVEFDFSENAVKWFFSSKGMPGSRSMNASPNPFPFEVKGTAMHGKIESKSEAMSDDFPAVEISVTYSAEIEKPVVEPPPTPAETAAAQRSPAAKAYLDRLDAVQKGDKARLEAASSPEELERMKGVDFTQVLPMLQSMMPKNVKVLKAVDTATESALWLSGIMDGKPQKGEVELHLVNGRWLVTLEVWNQ